MNSSAKFWVYHFDIDPLNPYRDIALAELAERGFDSFEETTTGLKAYAKQEDLRDHWWEELVPS